jgi:hypothetical protein
VRTPPTVDSDFKGVKLDASRVKLPPGYFQIDSGGDRFEQGTWKRRRGMRRTDIAQQAAPVTSIIGFELAGEGFGLMLAQGANLEGFVDVVQLEDLGVEGYGAGGYGVDEYGS